MANSNNKHPGVYFTTNQRVRRIPVEEDKNATVLFVPILSKKGPTDVLVRCNSVSEFITTFGSSEDIVCLGHEYLNIMNWLTNGGAVSVVRIYAQEEGAANVYATLTNKDATTNGDSIKAKYPGNYYNNLKVTMTKVTADSFDMNAYIDNVLVESMYRINVNDYNSRFQTSNYLGKAVLTKFAELDRGNSVEFNVSGSNKVNEKYSVCAISSSLKDYITATDNNKFIPQFKKAITAVLSDKLGVKVDIVMDAGYPDLIKQALVDLFASSNTDVRVRDDVLLYLSTYKYTSESFSDKSGVDISEKPIESELSADNLVTADGFSFCLYDQYMSVEDIYTERAGSTVFVTATYFLSELIPVNDTINHVGYAIMGRNRATLSKVKSLNNNPTSSQKDNLITKGINYVEKDTRGMCFATQFTYALNAATNTHAKKNINNVRVINKLIKELEDIGRNYLGEMADATTIINMQQAMNNKLLSWVQGRVLDNTSAVEVYADEYDNTVIHVVLDLKFVGIVERIYIVLNV